jgi:hypothetical protein
MFKEILFYILSLIFPKQEDVYIKEYMLDTKYIPQEIVWVDDINVLLSSYGYTEIFNTYNRKSNVIDTCDNCIYGYDFGFIYCKYTNRDISSMDEFSTTLEIYDIKNVLLFSKDIFPTVVPTVCKREYVILKTNDPNLEQNTYSLDIKMGILEKTDEQKEIKEWYSKDMSKKIVLEDDYMLWVYMR